MSQSNPLVKITNSLSYAIDVYDVFNPATNGETKPYTYTKLATLAAGETQEVQTIRLASQLQAMYTGKITKLNDFYFHQFPIKIMSAVQFSFGTPPPIEYTVASTDEDAMVQSFLFHRFAMANPNSALTKNLYAALKEGSVDKVNQFFAGTKNFKSCTLSSWNAVMAWLQMFTSGWQGPYYLYEKAPNPAPQGYVPVLVATMNIVSTATENTAILKMCTEDSKGNPVYASNPQTTTIIMNGDGTMVDSNPGQDVSVSLTPVWMNVIQTSMKDGVPVSSYISGPTVTGTIAGKEVVSSQTARQLPEKPANKSKESSFDAGFNKLCQSVGLIVGLLMLGDFGKKMFTSAKDKITSKKEKAKSKEEFEKEEKTIDATPNEDIVNEATAKESIFNSDASDIASNYSDISESLQENIMTESMNNTMTDIQSEITEQLQDGLTPTTNYEEAVSDLNNSFTDVQQKINDGDLSAANKEMNTAAENIETTIKENGNSMEQWESESLEKSADTVKNASEESNSLDEAQKEYDNEIENESNDSGFNEDGDFAETEPIESFEAAV